MESEFFSSRNLSNRECLLLKFTLFLHLNLAKVSVLLKMITLVRLKLNNVAALKRLNISSQFFTIHQI